MGSLAPETHVLNLYTVSLMVCEMKAYPQSTWFTLLDPKQ